MIAKIPTEPDKLKELEKVRTVGLRIVIFESLGAKLFPDSLAVPAPRCVTL